MFYRDTDRIPLVKFAEWLVRICSKIVAEVKASKKFNDVYAWTHTDIIYSTVVHIMVVPVIQHELYQMQLTLLLWMPEHVYAPRHTLLKDSWSASRNLHNHGLSSITRKSVVECKQKVLLWQNVRYLSNQIPTISLMVGCRKMYTLPLRKSF